VPGRAWLKPGSAGFRGLGLRNPRPDPELRAGWAWLGRAQARLSSQNGNAEIIG